MTPCSGEGPHHLDHDHKHIVQSHLLWNGKESLCGAVVLECMMTPSQMNELLTVLSGWCWILSLFRVNYKIQDGKRLLAEFSPTVYTFWNIQEIASSNT